MRGRKKQDTSKTKVLSFRITEQQHEVLQKNEWIKRELSNTVRQYLDSFVMPKE
jgi:hypothetical protein